MHKIRRVVESGTCNVMELTDVKIDKSEVVDHPERNRATNTSENIPKENSRKFGDTETGLSSENKLRKISSNCMIFWDQHKKTLVIVCKVLLLLCYLVYFGFALSYHLGDEGSWRLVGCTILGALLIAWKYFKTTSCYTQYCAFVDRVYDQYRKGNRSKITRRVLYVLMTLFMVVYLIVAVAIKTPENLRSLLGIFLFPFLLFLYSNNKRMVDWHTIFWSMAIQFIMALLILKTAWGSSVIQWCGTRLQEFVSNGEAGSKFIFGEAYVNHPFVFKSMVQVFVLIVGMSVLTYLGVIKFVVETVGIALAFCIGVSPPEGINTIGNIFLHVPESAMLVQQYLNEMTPSQLFVTYAGGMSTVGGVALVIFMSFGVPAAPLIAASAMSAPAALAASKLVFPSTEDEVAPEAPNSEGTSKSQGILRQPTSFMDAIILGINQSLALVVQAVIFIMTFVIILEFVNNTFIWLGDRIGVENMTVELLLSYLFYPLAFLMGARSEDCLFIGELLGIRTISLAVVAYPKLGPVIQNGLVFREYTSGGANNTWTQVGENIYLDNLNKTLIGGVMEPRSEIIATYALCGSASFAIVGLIIGSFEVIVPHRLGEITNHIFRSFIAGTVASYLTACFAGLLFEKDIGG